ncbi:HK97 family phage prohead protease [Phaeobacter sp.]|uniref:HK97 family phage prohead protease n=1 Tax=Phaeobacter sp. TaxID=1902409 RepID=UPI0025EF9300|nr:HK97 family phage prohead protease [Phaeobacter sp.]
MQYFPQLEHKFARFGKDLTVEEEAADMVAIRGYASLFGRVDTGGDVVRPGAYLASLKRRDAAGSSVKMLWQHDPAQPIGVWDSLGEDARGLRVEGRILTKTRRGAEAAALIAAGALDGLSIGYRTVKSTPRQGGGRELCVVDLWEVSLVTFPMLPSARLQPDHPGASKSAPEKPNTAAHNTAMPTSAAPNAAMDAAQADRWRKLATLLRQAAP